MKKWNNSIYFNSINNSIYAILYNQQKKQTGVAKNDEKLKNLIGNIIRFNEIKTKPIWTFF